MERLTEKNDETYFYPHCFEECDGAHETCSECEFDEKVCMRIGKYEDTGLTPPEIMELKERDTAKAAIITGYNCAIGCKVGECPTCGAMTRDYLEFCSECGQRIKWED